jgi:hypothetical protein
MSLLRQFIAVAVVSAVLAGCGSSTRKSSFDTRGLRAPEGFCPVKPSRIGLAEKIGRIDEGNGCQVANAWRVEALGEVSFSRAATMHCGMADPLHNWLENDVQPAARKSFGENVTAIDVAASYSCRPRNNQRGAKMSEHGFGNAIDIASFTLESGRKVSVLDGWHGSRDERGFLRGVHEAACGQFHTVLGPDADRHHRNHLHLDLQNRRSGRSYCR